MLAETDWAVLIPATISSITGLVVGVLMVYTRRDVRDGNAGTYDVKDTMDRVAPQITAIDNAVNGQPAGTEFLVDKVAGIKVEQQRVADQLTEEQKLVTEHRGTHPEEESGSGQPSTT